MIDEKRENNSYCREFHKRGGCKCCCCCGCKWCLPEHKEYWKGMFTRRASALEPLDGLRAVASLWVILCHVFGFYEGYHVCLSD